MTSSDLSAQPTHQRAIHEQAGTFWLNFLFFWSTHAPWVVRATTSFWMLSTWTFATRLRNQTIAHAAQLLDPGTDPAETRRLAKRMIRNFYLFVYDVARGRRLSRADLAARVECVIGREHYEQARTSKRGVILATAHLGSFEVGMASLCEFEKHIHVVFQRDHIARFERLRHDLHRKLGVIEAPVDEGWSVWARLREALARDQAVLVQADRVMPGQRGATVPFCGGRIEMPLGPVKLAWLSGAPIVPVFAVRTTRGRVRIIIEPPIYVQEQDVQPGRIQAPPPMLMLAQAVERHVKAHPDQWLVLHNIWLDDETAAV